jgi:hypothetical protein
METGRSENGRNELGRSENGRNELGRSENGRNYGRRICEIGRNIVGIVE